MSTVNRKGGGAKEEGALCIAVVVTFLAGMVAALLKVRISDEFHFLALFIYLFTVV